MSWRNHEDHKAETKAVREALKAVGINAKVGHGSGTAWAWLKVNIGSGQQWGEHEKSSDGIICFRECVRCVNLRKMRDQTAQIIRDVTGRTDEYCGDTNILEQDAWNESKKCRVAIAHPKWNGGAV